MMAMVCCKRLEKVMAMVCYVGLGPMIVLACCQGLELIMAMVCCLGLGTDHCSGLLSGVRSDDGNGSTFVCFI